MQQDMFFVKKIEDTLRYYNKPLKNDKIKDDIAHSLMESYPNANVAYDYPIKETDVKGIKLDFNFGLRLEIPEGKYHVKISDADSKMVFYDNEVSNMQIFSFEKDYVKWRVEVKLKNKIIYSHTLDLNDKPVLIVYQHRTIGDFFAFIPYFAEFQRFYNCKLNFLVAEHFKELVANFLPDIPFVEKNNYDHYATYYPIMGAGVFRCQFDDTGLMPMEHAGKIVFGLHYNPVKPKFTPTKPREIAEPYVCISVQASGTMKSWLYDNGKGWDIIIRYLKKLGYRVLCIDKNKTLKDKYTTVNMPAQVEDFTGNIPIIERANMLYYADFFIGLSSGLSWLANLVDCPVVMIAGFTKDWYEFYTPYRVINHYACNGCFNDIGRPFIGKGCFHKGRPRELECQKLIHPNMVIEAIDRLISDKKSNSLYVRRDL